MLSKTKWILSIIKLRRMGQRSLNSKAEHWKTSQIIALNIKCQSSPQYLERLIVSWHSCHFPNIRYDIFCDDLAQLHLTLFCCCSNDPTEQTIQKWVEKTFIWKTFGIHNHTLNLIERESRRNETTLKLTFKGEFFTITDFKHLQLHTCMPRGTI